MLVEGVGIRPASRLAGVHQETVLAVLELAGQRCARLMDSKVRAVNVSQIQVDEIWSFVQKKQKMVRALESDLEVGDQYTFYSIDPESKLIVNFLVGKRTGRNAYVLLTDLAGRMTRRFQLTTDAFRPYTDCVEMVFGADIDYAQLIKLYGGTVEPGRERYAPSKCIGSVPCVITGDPDPGLICTSHIERSNLSMRTFMRRLTRLSLGFSKKLANLKHAVALYFAYYNFCSVHGSLRVTPAMEAGISDHVWTIEELVTA